MHARKKGLIALMLTAGLLTMASAARADNAKAIAVVLSASGKTEIKKDAAWKPGAFGTVLDHGDMLRTGENGFLSLVFTDDKSQLKIRPNTTLTIQGERNDDYSIAKRVNMELGELFADVQKQKGSLQIATPTSVASVKGTQFWVLVEIDGRTQVLALQGLVELRNLVSGNVSDVEAGKRGTSGSEGDVTIDDLPSEDVPEIIEDIEESRTIDIRFIDEDGNERHLIINYSEEDGNEE